VDVLIVLEIKFGYTLGVVLNYAKCAVITGYGDAIVYSIW